MDAVAWNPAVSLDITTAGRRDLEALIDQFRKHFDGVPLAPIGLTDGWHEITPQIAENLLRHNPPGANRKLALGAVQYYARQMKQDGGWKRTGQPIIVSDQEMLLDAQHRCWAGYLSGVTFPSYVVTQIPHIENIFAYIDNGKSRTLTDVLQTAGVNGIASKVAAAVKISREYDAGCYAVEDNKTLPKPTPIEVLGIVMDNPVLVHAAHLQMTQHGAANDLIDHDGTACFVAWKISEAYGDEKLIEFMEELESEETEQSAIVLLRKRLLADISADKQMRKSLKLGYITKAFNAWRLGQVLTRLNLKTDEPWPRFVDTSVDAEAA
jgi:hypothetical protein